MDLKSGVRGGDRSFSPAREGRDSDMIAGARIATAHRHAVADIERMIGGGRNQQPKAPRHGHEYRVEVSKKMYAKDM